MTASKIEKERENSETAKKFDGVIADKIRFAVYLFPETMKTINSLYKGYRTSLNLLNTVHPRSVQ